MKTILLNLGVFGEHGIDQAALNLLNAIPKNQYKIILHVLYELGYDSRLLKELDQDIQVHFAVPNNTLLGKIHFYRRKNLFLKILDGLALFLINQKIVGSIKNICPTYVIDYDSSLQKIASKIDCFSMAFIHFSPNQLRAGRKRSQMRMGQRLASYDKIILLCEEMKEKAKKLWPNLENKYSVIPNPIDIDSIILKSKIHHELPSGVSSFQYFLSIGRLTAQKNFSFLIDAYKIASDHGVSWPLIIIGDGDLKEALTKKIEALILTKKVFLLGHKDNPYPFIKNAGSFLLGSDFEGFGIVLVEAMILDCPILSTNCPVGPSDILQHGKLGLLSRVGDVHSFAEKISYLEMNELVRSQLRSNAKLAINKYQAVSVSKQIINLLPN